MSKEEWWVRASAYRSPPPGVIGDQERCAAKQVASLQTQGDSSCELVMDTVVAQFRQT